MPTLAHLSDLHFGAGETLEQTARALVERIEREAVDRVLVTGDLTQNGLRSELERYQAAFAPLIDAGCVSVVPGNHDRRGDDLVDELMPGRPRFRVEDHPGLRLVCLDSTGTHNRSKLAPQGRPLTLEEVDGMVDALATAPTGALAILALHHHPIPLPGDDLVERITGWIGLHMPRELFAGSHLLESIEGHCDLVLFGHRHIPRELWRPEARMERPLGLFNAGCSTRLGQVRVFSYEHGRLTEPVRWLTL